VLPEGAAGGASHPSTRGLQLFQEVSKDRCRWRGTGLRGCCPGDTQDEAGGGGSGASLTAGLDTLLSNTVYCTGQCCKRGSWGTEASKERQGFIGELQALRAPDWLPICAPVLLPVDDEQYNAH